MKYVGMVCCVFFSSLLYAAQKSACAAQASSAVSNHVQASLPPSYIQQYAHCSGHVLTAFKDTAASLTPEQAAQMAHGPQHFFTAQVLGKAFIASLHQQHAEHNALDLATRATAVAPVQTATQHYLPEAEHQQGLATRADMQQIMEETKKMREELAQIKLKLAEKEAAQQAAQKIVAPVPKKGAVPVDEVVRRSVTPPAGTVKGFLARVVKDLF